MRGSRFNGQFVVRNFAFANQEQLVEPRLVLPGDQPARAHANPRARDLHTRADQMFAMGYEASGWRLRQQAWAAEGSL